MLDWLKKFIYSNKQTKYFILMAIIYMVAIIWSTIQAYARLEYSRTEKPMTTNQTETK